MSAAEPCAGWYCEPGSPLEGWAEGLAWFWRLGPRVADPRGADVAFAEADGAERILEPARSGDLRAAIVVADGPGGPIGPVPAREVATGTASFGGARVEGSFLIFSSGTPSLTSSLGAHAIADGPVLMLAADVVEGWGRLDHFWVPEEILLHLGRRDVGTRLLPAIGAIRLDDFPGTAQHQVEERANPDRKQARRARRWARRYRGTGAVLNLAVACQALEDGERVPLERVWPRAVAAVGDGCRQGAFEAVCHGALHLDPDVLARGEIEFREFKDLERPEAEKRIDMAIRWQTQMMSAPPSFVAPAWAYGPASDQVAADRGLARWHWPRPGVPLVDGRLHETLIDGLLGLWRLDYSPLIRLARAGIPPTIITHGSNMDGRIPRLRAAGAAGLPTLARLFVRRDLTRLAGLEGIEWIGAGSLVQALAEHGERP